MDLQGQYVPRPPNDFLSRQEKFTWRGESRWRNTAGNRIYTYDQLHGHVEVYNRRGSAPWRTGRDERRRDRRRSESKEDRCLSTV